MKEQHHYRGSVVWPVILISAGVVFLLNNLGVLSWNVWGSLWRLWPLLLIAIGLDILIGRRSLLGSLVVALLLVAALGAAIWLGVPGLGVPRWSSGDLSRLDAVERTETIDEPLRGAERAEVEIGFGTGNLYLGTLPEGSSDLIVGTVDLGHNETLALDHSGSGNLGRLSLHSRNATVTGLNAPQGGAKAWDLELNRDIPIRLKVDTGIGSSSLDLARLNLSGLEIDGGVGQTSVTLPQHGRFAAKVDGGLGEVTIIVPQDMAARIRIDRGFSGISVNGDFDRRDDEYVSPGYGTAANRVDLEVSGGLGRIVIRQVVEE